ncbi:MAG: substrate-binding domain-containing protein [Bacteroidales bacterium]|nr:substrate-binding domain-containing protein [Bacteroidales bacterium]
MEENKKKIRIKDIAKLANVSVGTVDRVLHNRGNVNEKKWAKVIKIIDELNYTPNLLAKSLASKKIIRIAVLIPEPYDNNNLYWENPLVGINQAIQELIDNNVEIQIYKFSTKDKKSFIIQSKIILKGNYDGIIFAPSFHKESLAFLKKCNEEKTPVIFIDSTIEGADVKSYFGQNAVQSGYLAAKLMSCCVKKNSKVLILNLSNKLAITRHLKNREKGFLNFIDNLEEPKKITTISAEIDPTDNQEPEKSLTKIFSDNPDLEGVFVTNARVQQVAKFISKKNYTKLFLGGYDLAGNNIKYLNSGVIDFLICQKPEDQGYKSVMAMFTYILTEKPGKRINYSPIDVVFKENIDFYTNI